MVKAKDLIGKKFGRLFITERLKNTNDGRTRWKCECECGNVVSVTGRDLRIGHTKSCGCYKRDQSSKANKKHGLANTRLYFVWTNMINRCYDTRDRDYHNYGMRGIVVCDEWKGDPTNFIKWCSAQDIPKGYTLDRKNNNENYCPENCRFVSPSLQARNRRSNILVEHDGETFILKDFVEKYGVVPYACALQRIQKNGMEPKEAAMTPKKRK